MELRMLRLEIRLYRSCQSLSNNVLMVFINPALLITTLKEVFAMLAKIISNVRSYYYALSLRKCASDQSAIFVGNDFLNLLPHAADL
jgi:uncharacterized membrane protein